jgi:hypothetical protein
MEGFNKMSGDVFSSIDPNEKPVEYKQHCSLNLSKKVYCCYEGKCEYDRVVNRDVICLMCRYRRPLDIPEMIKEALK